MISFLRGKILEKGETYVILEINGVGYKVFVTPETMGLATGENISLYTYHKVSEDGQSLFGLSDFPTLQFFELLITVSGVGPKVALAILAAARAEAVKQAIVNQDPAIFTRISGVGLKTAEKIIVELKNKIVADGRQQVMQGSGEVFEALLVLGYNQREVREVINKLDSSLPTQEQVRQALRIIGKS